MSRATLAAWARVLRLEFQLDSLLIWCASAGAAAASGRPLHAGFFAAGTLMLVMSQAALEMADGYYDFVQGAHGRKDGGPTWTGGSGVLAEGALVPRHVQIAAFSLGGAAAVLFAWLTFAWTREGGLVVGLVGAACGAFWSMPPLRLSYRGFGEVLQGVVMGPLMAAEAWVVATGHLDLRAFAIGAPFGLVELAMGLSHNIVDREDDARAGKRTLVVRIGPTWAARLASAALAAALLSLALLGWLRVLPRASMAVALLVLPLCLSSARLAARAAGDGAARVALGRYFPQFRVLVYLASGSLAVSLWASPAGARVVLPWLAVFGALPLVATLRKSSWPSLYDLGAPLYNPVSRALFFERRVRRDAIDALAMPMLDGAAPRALLDLGCGTGFHYADVGRALPHAHIVGVDPSAPSLVIAARAAEDAGLSFHAVLGDAADSALPDGDVDAVLASFALSVMPRWREALARGCSRLRDGGRVVVLEQELPRGGAWSLLRPLFVLGNKVLGAALDRDYAGELARHGLHVRVARRGAYVVLVGERGLPPPPS